MSGQNLAGLVEAAGVVGAGGAGFPTHIKLACKASLVIANGCECEPLLRSDAWLMENRPLEVLAGLELVRRQVKAPAGVLALKGKNPVAGRAVEAALGQYPNLSLKRIDDFFPAGDEQVLTRLVTGRTVPPGGIPLQVGVVVNNVATLSNVYRAQKGIPVTSRIVTVGGAVWSPFVAEVPLGTPFGELIKAAGGPNWLKNPVDLDYSTDNTRVYRFVLIVGGPMMGRVACNLSLGVEKTTGGLILLPTGHPLVIKKTARTNIRYNRITCCACNECTLSCPRNQLGHPIYPHKITGSFATREPGANLEGAFLCSECGLCEYYACTMGVSPLSINREIKRTRPRPKRFPDPVSSGVKKESSPVYGQRLLHRLNLAEYVSKPSYKQVISERVSLSLTPGFGTAPVPVVRVGEKVDKGAKIAEIPTSKTGANLHAPIKGKVMEVSSERIVISEK